MTDDDLKVYEENQQLKAEVARLKKSRAWVSIRPIDGALLFGATLALGGLWFVSSAVHAAILKPNPAPEISKCFVEGSYDRVFLKAVWTNGQSSIVSPHENVTDAIAAARQLDCPLMRPEKRP